MSTLKPIPSETPEVVDGVPTYECQAQTNHICKGRKLKLDEAWVRSVQRMFETIRGTDVDKSDPLTANELRKQVLCPLHGQGFFPLKKTLGLMARWREQIKQKAERHEDRMRETALRRANPATTQPIVVPTKEKNYGPPISHGGRKKKPSGEKKNKGNKQQQKKGR